MSVFSAEIRQMIIPGRGGEYGPLPPLLVAMTMVTGLVDAFSYLVLGHVFVANMTGHVVFLAFALIGRELAPNRRRRRRPYSAAAWELWSRTRGLAGGHRLPDQSTMEAHKSFRGRHRTWAMVVATPGARQEGRGMRAVIVSQFGGPEQLRLADVADPVPGQGQVRIAVHTAGVNPVDPFNRADGSWAGLRVPCILGYDIAGVVDSVGPGVTGWRPGDRVIA
ncbi:MAG TPA: DUF1275 family protein [Streptosporangiaceae bacterium]|jgi:hypothetical protein